MHRFAILVALVLATAAQAAEPYLFELLKQQPYRASWDALLNAENDLPDWVIEFSKSYDGVASPSQIIRLNGSDFRFASVCKPHDCPGNDLNVLFGPGGQPAWALLNDDGAGRWLGHPDDQIRAAITQASQQ
jgi:hypothetical protein